MRQSQKVRCQKTISLGKRASAILSYLGSDGFISVELTAWSSLLSIATETGHLTRDDWLLKHRNIQKGEYMGPDPSQFWPGDLWGLCPCHTPADSLTKISPSSV